MAEPSRALWLRFELSFNSVLASVFANGRKFTEVGREGGREGGSNGLCLVVLTSRGLVASDLRVSARVAGRVKMFFIFSLKFF